MMITVTAIVCATLISYEVLSGYALVTSPLQHRPRCLRGDGRSQWHHVGDAGRLLIGRVGGVHARAGTMHIAPRLVNVAYDLQVAISMWRS